MSGIITELKKQILEAQDKIKSIQAECSHPSPCVTSVNKGDTGNWDNKDTYWTEHHCSLCDKKWSTEQ